MTETKFIGKYPEIDVKGIHHCFIEGCHDNCFGLNVSFTIEIENKHLIDTATKLIELKNGTNKAIEEETEWQITIRPLRKKR
jgi:hypothetical protein